MVEESEFVSNAILSPKDVGGRRDVSSGVVSGNFQVTCQVLWQPLSTYRGLQDNASDTGKDVIQGVQTSSDYGPSLLYLGERRPQGSGTNPFLHSCTHLAVMPGVYDAACACGAWPCV